MGTYTVDIESIERLANKVKELVELLEQTKNELSKQVEDNVRLTKVIEAVSYTHLTLPTIYSV